MKVGGERAGQKDEEEEKGGRCPVVEKGREGERQATGAASSNDRRAGGSVLER
jgi:hypothetical protein